MHLHQNTNDTVSETREGESQVRLKSHKLSVTCVCIDSKDRYAFTGSKDGSIIKWCLKTRKLLGKINPITKKEYDLDQSLQLKHHLKHVNCLTISSDDKFFASGGWDKHIRIWSPNDLSWLHIFSLHKQEITALAFRQGYPMLYSGSADRSVMLWTLEDDDNRCYVESLYGHESAITSMDVLRKERVLSSGGRDQSIRIWKIVEQAQTVFESKHESVDSARYIDDKTFVSGGEDGTISIWTTMKRSPVFSIRNAHQPIEGNDESYNFDQKGLGSWISALATFSFKVSSKQAKATKKRKLDETDEDVLVPRYEDDGRESDQDEASTDEGGKEESESEMNVIGLIASGSCNSEIRIWKLVKTGSKHELRLHQSINCPGFVNDLRFTSDGLKLVAACGQEHKLGRWWKVKGSKNCMRVFDVNKFV